VLGGFRNHRLRNADSSVDVISKSWGDKDGAEVECATAGMDQKLFVSRYLTALPSAAQINNFLERDRMEIKALIEHSRAEL